MKNSFACILLILLVLTFGCTTDDNIDTLNKLNTKDYNLESVSDPAISGFVEFTENPNGSVSVDIELINTMESQMYPAQISMNTAVESGSIVITLSPVNGTTGKSTTVLSAFDDGTTLAYSQLLTYDGYLSVSLDNANPNVLVAQADIGENELTGLSTTYNLVEENTSGISGVVNFFERRNGEALSEIVLENAVAGENYLAEIRTNDFATTGTTVFTYNTIDGTTGETKINVSNLDGQTDFFGYESVLEFDGHITVTDNATTILVAQTNIGINAENQMPETISYDVTLNGTTAYVFDGNGLVAAENPDFTFIRGNTYIFNMNVAGQPFYIKTSQTTGTTDLYNDGVTGNGNETGIIEFTVQDTAPDFLFYNSEFEANLSGVITVTD